MLAAFTSSLPDRDLGLDATTVGPYRGMRALLERVCCVAERAREVPLGKSIEGRPLVAFDVGPLDARRTTVVIAGLHAMEWIGVEVALALFEKLAADPPADRRVRFHLMANPDGFARVEAGLRSGRRAFDRTNARGVDLNRNWPTHWKKRSLVAKLLPFLGDGGYMPRSEPEVDTICQGLDALVQGGGVIDRVLSLHSFGGKVLYPYGGVWRRVHDFQHHRGEAEWVADRTGYDAIQTSRWVPGTFARGMELDHFHDAYGSLSLLLECSRGGARWTDPRSWVHPFRWFNPPRPSEVIDNLLGPLDAFIRD